MTPQADCVADPIPSCRFWSGRKNTFIVCAKSKQASPFCAEMAYSYRIRRCFCSALGVDEKGSNCLKLLSTIVSIVCGYEYNHIYMYVGGVS